MKRCGLILMLVLLASGCSQQSYRPMPLDAAVSLTELQTASLQDARIQARFEQAGRAIPAGEWSLPDLVMAAEALSPDMAIALARLEQKQAALQTASQRPNPGLSVGTEHHSETDGGVTPWSVGALFDFILERPQKRAARQAVARAGIEQARLQLRDTALSIRLQVGEALQQLHDVQLLIQAQQQRSETLVAILTQLQRRVELGEANSFEVSTARIDLQGLRLEQGRNRVRAAELEQRLASAVGISVAGMRQVLPHATSFAKSDYKMSAQTKLQTGMLNSHPRVLAALARYQQAEAELQLVIEKQIPDFVLSPGLLFDQEDRVWQLAGQWVLPVFHRNEGPVQEAEANRQKVAAEFLQVQQQFLTHLQGLHTRADALLQTRELARQLRQELQQRQDLLSRQQRIGFAGSLEILRGQLEFQQASEALLEIEADYHLAALRLQHLTAESVVNE